MYARKIKTAACFAVVMLFAASAAFAQMGRTWPSEKKIVPDPVTGLPLTFLTSTDGGYSQSKIYQTHRQWTVRWQVAHLPRSARDRPAGDRGERRDRADRAGDRDGFMGMLCAGNKTMKLVVMTGGGGGGGRGRGAAGAPGAAPAEGGEAPAAEGLADHSRLSRSTSPNSSPTWPPGP